MTYNQPYRGKEKSDKSRFAETSTQTQHNPGLWQEKIRELGEEIKRIDRFLGHLATRRLISMTATVLFLLGAMWSGRLLLYLFATICLAIFILCLRRFRRGTGERDFKKALRRVYQARLSRRGEAWKSFPDTGQAILDQLESGSRAAGHNSERFNAEALRRYHLAKDLDVLGRDSLYQRISLAFSEKAKERLADYLLTIDPSAPMMRERQDAVRELNEHDDFSLKMAALIELARAKESGQRRSQASVFIRNTRNHNTNSSAVNCFRELAIRLFPLLMIFLLMAAFLLPEQSIFWDLALGLGSIQLLTALVRLKKTNLELEGIEAFNAYIKMYLSIIETVAGESFESELLRDLQAKLFDENKTPAARSLAILAKIAGRCSSRKNTIAWILSNAILLFDEHCLKSYRQWKDSSGLRIEIWLEVISEFEALLSLAATAQCYDHHVWPDIIDTILESNDHTIEKTGLEIKSLHHPLIDNDRSVPNDVLLSQASYIITGSNMSGKTTYLRAVGLAVLMTQAGACIPAAYAVIPPLAIHSSIRVDDNVAAGISSFYAEILRIRAMVEAVKSGQPLLLLIDEIFRGTNSADRVTGAYEAIRRLSLPHVVLLVSTHDMELCELAEESAIKAHNSHFSESYEGDTIRFDYKIRPGRSETTNARYLLRLAGIITED